MSREQAEQLASLMDEARPTRPEGVEVATLLVDGESAQLVAIWRDRETLDAYLATADVPRGHGAHAQGRRGAGDACRRRARPRLSRFRLAARAARRQGAARARPCPSGSPFLGERARGRRGRRPPRLRRGSRGSARSAPRVGGRDGAVGVEPGALRRARDLAVGGDVLAFAEERLVERVLEGRSASCSPAQRQAASGRVERGW